MEMGEDFDHLLGRNVYVNNFLLGNLNKLQTGVMLMFSDTSHTNETSYVLNKTKGQPYVLPSQSV